MNYLVIFLILILTALPFGQTPPKPAPQANPREVALTEEQQQQQQQLVKAETELENAFNQAVEAAINTPAARDKSVEIHAAIIFAGNQVRMLRLSRAVWLEKLRSDLNCKGCQLAPDGKHLVSTGGN